MARKDDVIIKAVLGACEEVGLERGRQAFAVDMAQSIIRLMGEKKLTLYQIKLALGWNGRYIWSAKISRDKMARAIKKRLDVELELLERPSSAKAQRIRMARSVAEYY